jgi:hypothetical protein
MQPQGPETNLQFVIARIKARLKRETGKSYVTSAASDALFDHLKLTNTLDKMGAIVMRLGCQRAIIAPPGGRVSRAKKADAPASQMTFSDIDDGWLDEELAISDGIHAIRKDRCDCTLIDLKASIALRLALSEATRASAMRDQALIDEHPEWETFPMRTVSWILGIGDDNDDGDEAA